MRYVKPHYYDAFKCIADKCPDTCCAGWQIVIDDNTLEKYEKYALDGTKGETSAETSDASFAERLAESIDWGEGYFLQHGRRCAMLNDHNLCDLIHAKGEEWLCDTCSRYPRHIEEFEGVREYSLSLSCPVAADMMLKMTEQTQFLVEEDDEPDPLEEEFEDFDFMLFTQLEDARAVMFEILQNRELPIINRMALLMEMGRDMQECIDEDRLFDVQDVVDDYAKMARGENLLRDVLGERAAAIAESESECETAWVQVSMPEILTGVDRFQQLKEGFEIYTKLERLREEWTEVLEGTQSELYDKGYQHYEAIYEEFCKSFVEGLDVEKCTVSTSGFEEKARAPRWEIFLEQILTFFLYTYFCGAVYDDCIYSKVAMSVMSACYIQEFIMYIWYARGKQMDLEECIRVAYRYAREIEHSDLNLNDLEEWLLDRM